MPGAVVGQRRDLTRAGLHGLPAPRRELAAGQGDVERPGLAGDGRELAGPLVWAGAGREQGTRVGMPGVSEDRPGRPALDHGPAYITARSSAMLSTIDKSWVTNTTDMPVRRRNSASRSMIPC